MTGKGLSTIGPLELASLNDDNFVITIVFPHSTAKNYPMAVAIAELSDVNKIGEIAGKKFHLASFSKTPDQLSRAANLCYLVYGITGVQAFINGELVVNVQELSSSLGCYARSLKANNQQSYCECVSNYPGNYLLPCRLLRGWEGGVSDKLPFSLADQIQALAVSKGCSWCPNFHPEKMKRI
ncbi:MULTISPECIES: hypothetical protein [Citrobacter freundii complex]|uniref:hypothetical protein n=1 Tax=Citrobacter freundii complex TaxID=1344959 RepID=UPI000651814D|nr:MULTISPECIES: hypothetical protein [Citrobacter freundii complex]EKT9197282.1 hypothetical protein [Citrobacter freundii]MBA7949986.1 hypothetical protein [Citrobacter freundii]MBJ9199228.1 hypothetical protein [Citrobacter freundii]UHD37467.1 hypothetical protein LT989_01855 [Citrobacter portucalensis]HBK4942660.1 hypothetical protein [Citrobacter freundii]